MVTSSTSVRVPIALICGVLLFSSGLEAAPPKAAASKSVDIFACFDKCESVRAKTVDGCEDPYCERDATELSQKCRADCSVEVRGKAKTQDRKTRLLSVKHHAQSTPVWCWAAAIAMSVEYIKKRPVTDCEVASKMDRLTGGNGYCCDSRGHLQDSRCFRGGYATDMSSVMRAFGVPMAQINRPLTWEELRSSIDRGYPVLVARNYAWGGGHAVVIVGYRPPSTVLIDDPWNERQVQAAEESYFSLAGDGTMANAWRSFHGWRVSWVFDPELSGNTILANRAKGIQPPVVALSEKPLSNVRIEFPELTGDSKSTVEERANRFQEAVRICYDNALAKGSELPPHASVRMTLGVDKGSTSFVMLKESGGLPQAVTDCVTEAMGRLRDVFPKKSAIDESQSAVLSFEKI